MARTRPFAAALFAGALFHSATVAAQQSPLEQGRAALALSHYAEAATQLAEAVKQGKDKNQALLLQTRLFLWTGKYAEAVKTGNKIQGADGKAEVAPFVAEALSRQGKLADAVKLLEGVQGHADAHRARLLLGELYLRQGKRKDAEGPLMKIVDAYNDDTIKDDDAAGMTLVGRAAYLLRAYEDANNAFNKAEQAGGKKRVETLLYRAELFLDKYNPGDAAGVVRDALKLAPNDPRALVMAAHVKLAQAMDFAAAEKLIDAALKVDPELAEAYFVRTGLRLRTMDLDGAMAAANKGLGANPEDLDLLSIKAATRFLAEDQTGFEALKKQVLGLNGQYSRFFTIVGEFAEWEHRYGEIVTLMREAVTIDPLDAKAYATLGLNLIRNGDDKQGLEELNKAWRRDKFNVRVYNTLNLFEKVVAKEYVDVTGPHFRIRYHKTEKNVLERYLPPLLDRAWGSMVKRYGFTPTQPVGIEMYADPQHFSIRTSGLPNVGIQGVCFGKTLAALSPSAGPYNWGMVVWHELGHVFHIQQSKNRVPRWFTEGLAEYETIIVRPEWQREHDVDLYDGLRHGKVPKVGSFNQAFTHAGSTRDVVVAYYTASQLAVFLAQKYGFAKIPEHLQGWGAGKHTPEVVEKVLGFGPDELDRRFQEWLRGRLARYFKQFVPNLTPPDSLEEARKAVADDPKSAAKHVRLALALLASGKVAEAQATLQLGLRLDPKEPDGVYLKLRLAMAQKHFDEAKRIAAELVKSGHDGYAVQMKLADCEEVTSAKPDKMREHFLKAHAFDPSQAEPLQALYDLGAKTKDEEQQLFALRQLSKLEQHDRRVWGRLLELLVKRGEWAEARAIGEGAMYVDVMSPRMHFLYARALARSGRQITAIFELNSAILAQPKPAEAAVIYRKMAEGYRKLKRPDYADQAEALAKQMDGRTPPPPNPDHEEQALRVRREAVAWSAAPLPPPLAGEGRGGGGKARSWR